MINRLKEMNNSIKNKNINNNVANNKNKKQTSVTNQSEDAII